MPSNDSGTASDVTTMRWIARLIAIPWAYVTLVAVLFVAAVGIEESKPMAFLITIVVAAIVLGLGPAILAGVWRMEAVGGAVLAADCLLVLIWYIAVPQFPPALLVPLMLPPLAAGCLFLACHAKSKGRSED